MFRRLQYFIAIAEELHFARAAAVLGIDASPLSRAIKRLEKDLGTPLVACSTRCTRLTADGQRLLPLARKMVDLDIQMRLVVQEGIAENQRKLVIGVLEAVHDWRVSRLLATSVPASDDVKVQIVELTTTNKLMQLETGSMDAAISHEKSESDDIISQVLWTDSIVAVLPYRNTLESKSVITLAELKKERLVVPNEFHESGALATVLPALGLPSDTREVFVGLATALTLVGAGMAITLMPVTLANTISRDDIIYRPLSSKRARSTTYLSHSRSNRSPALAQFLSHVKTTV